MKYFMIPSDKTLDKYKEELVLPLLNYSIGFDIYFSCEEIIEISKVRKVNVIINRLLHKDDIDSVKNVIDSIKDYVSLFIVEDLGLLSMIPSDKVVLYQNHIQVQNILSFRAVINTIDYCLSYCIRQRYKMPFISV